MGDGYLSIRSASRFAATLWIALGLVACSGVPFGPQAAGPEDAEPVPVHYAPTNGIAGQYIVVFAEGEHVPPGLARRLVDQHGGELEFEYSEALNGFAARLPEQALEGIRRNPHVALIEQDVEVATAQTIQASPPWGLDRIDQRALPLDKAYGYTHTGGDVTAYIVDTGILYAHEEFGGRAVPGYDGISDGQNGNDCNGHGTQVAGVVGGAINGVAKDVRLVSVRVVACNGSGSVSGVIAGLDWIAKNNRGPAVANISLASGRSDAFNSAVRTLIQAGVQTSVAAGNFDEDACLRSPASTLEAVTVGATTSTDTRASFSSWGPCVDVFAPGYGIKSAWISSTTAEAFGGGTSMAAPHAAGVMALWLQANPALTPTQLHDMVLASSTKGVVTDAKSANADVLHSQSGTSPPSAPPTASFTTNCAGLTCSFDASTSSGGGSAIAHYDWTFGDGAGDSGVTTSHSYAAAGSYTVSLSVTNTQGATGHATRTVSVSAANQSPAASFTFACSSLTCDFIDHSTDADGSVVAWSWSFGDGTTSATRHPSHVFATDGTYAVTLTATDDAGATASTTQSVTVSASAPTADFTYTCTGADCEFTDASVSPSSVRLWAWSFGDGNTSSLQNTSHGYRASGTYSVRLEVTDEHDQTSWITRSVTVTVPTSGIALSAGPYRVRGAHYVDLVWTGASGSQVTIHRDGVLVGTVSNTGRHTDAIGGRGQTDYRYRVCEAGSNVCSPEVLVEFR
jgi:PKD repeat protein